MRIFLQIWDGQGGEIAWEGYEEIIVTGETFTEKWLIFYDITRTIAKNMVDYIPKNHTGNK